MSQDKAVQQLIDRAALQELVAAYFRGVDRCDFDLLRSLYHPDGWDDHGDYFRGPASDYVDWLSQVLPALDATQHLMGAASFAIDGDRAEGEIQVAAYHRSKPPEPREFFTCGRYLDVYERRDGVWRFLKRSMANDWVDSRPLNPEAYAEFFTSNLGRNGPDDPLYKVLTLFPRGHRPAQN